MIKVKSGRDKSRVQYKRNAVLGSIGMCMCHLNNVYTRQLLDFEENAKLHEVLNKLHELDFLMRKNKGSKIEIVNIKDE